MILQVILPIAITIFCGLIAYAYLADKKSSSDKFDALFKIIDELKESNAHLADVVQELTNYSTGYHKDIKYIKDNCQERHKLYSDTTGQIRTSLSELGKKVDDLIVDVSILNAYKKIDKL